MCRLLATTYRRYIYGVSRAPAARGAGLLISLAPPAPYFSEGAGGTRLVWSRRYTTGWWLGHAYLAFDQRDVIEYLNKQAQYNVFGFPCG